MKSFWEWYFRRASNGVVAGVSLFRRFRLGSLFGYDALWLGLTVRFSAVVDRSARAGSDGLGGLPKPGSQDEQDLSRSYGPNY